MLFCDVGYRGKDLLPMPRQDHSFGKKEAVFGYRRKNLLPIPRQDHSFGKKEAVFGYRRKKLASNTQREL